MSENEPSAFVKIQTIIQAIPTGKVLTYGEVAARAGLPGSARTVVWVLKAWSEKAQLPWHRVVRRGPMIAIKNPDGWLVQKALLEAEGWTVDAQGKLHREPPL